MGNNAVPERMPTPEQRRYMIPNGDAKPCVFIHFPNTNIKTHIIPEILQSPLFRAYHEGQPFNRNHLIPCPMLKNPDLLVQMVYATGAHQTNVESPESVEHLCEKCKNMQRTGSRWHK